MRPTQSTRNTNDKRSWLESGSERRNGSRSNSQSCSVGVCTAPFLATWCRSSVDSPPRPTGGDFATRRRVRSTRIATAGYRARTAQVWSSLPDDITAALSLIAFRHRLFDTLFPRYC